MAETIPVGSSNIPLIEVAPTRKIGRVERFLGPENYRIVRGLLKTPASILGFTLIGIFILIAIFAPQIIPPVNPNNAYQIPRDGFSYQPQPMGSKWTRNAPPLPFWWKPIMRY